MSQKPYHQILPQNVKLLGLGWQNVILGAFPSNFARVKLVGQNLWALNPSKLSGSIPWVTLGVTEWEGDLGLAWGAGQMGKCLSGWAEVFTSSVATQEQATWLGNGTLG
jgi:hypothetical protein